MPTMTPDERRALGFIALLVFSSALLRLVATPEPAPIPVGGALELASHVDSTRAAVAERERAERPLEEGERIDPNTASQVELQRLTGVGPALAARIVADREARGRFGSAAELVRVPGVGERTVERLAPHLALPRTALGSRGGGGGRGAVPAAARSRGSLGSSAAGGSAEPVDLNRADEAALMTLPGIGPVTARRIVVYRDSTGGFRSVEELSTIQGIGTATLERIRGAVRVRP